MPIGKQYARFRPVAGCGRVAGSPEKGVTSMLVKSLDVVMSYGQSVVVLCDGNVCFSGFYGMLPDKMLAAELLDLVRLEDGVGILVRDVNPDLLFCVESQV